MAGEHDGAPPQKDFNDKLLLDLGWEKQEKKVRTDTLTKRLQEVLAMHIIFWKGNRLRC